MFHLPPRNKSFFWAGITLILPSLRAYISMIVKNGDSTLLWFDNWLEGCAPKDLWLDLFNDCNFPWITIKQFVQDSPSHEIFFCTTTFSESLSFWSSIPNCSSNQDDMKICNLESNRTFTICSLQVPNCWRKCVVLFIPSFGKLNGEVNFHSSAGLQVRIEF